MTRTTGAALLALLFGLLAGGSLVYEMIPSREPAACKQARELTDEYLVGQSNLISAVQARAEAADFVERNQADDEVRRITRELEPIGVKYAATFKACEEAS
jgi:hypothetical protein